MLSRSWQRAGEHQMSEINKFCIKSCLVGLEKSQELLNKNESVYDAAADMHSFVKDCIKTCPYKDRMNFKK